MITKPTLMLTALMTPHQIVPWFSTMRLLMLGKIEPLELYADGEVVTTETMTFEVPAVARLIKVFPEVKRGVKFSKLNICLRDGFRCQYCGVQFPMKRLNYDHVVPKRLGGPTTWENIVASCYPCNDYKAGRTPQQAKMKLKRAPFRPLTLPLASPVLMGMKDVPAEWMDYLSDKDLSMVG